MSGIIFSSVKAQVETVGRTRAHTFAELDTLTSMWTGPTTQADTVPAIGSAHPEYPNMELRGTHKVGDVAGVTKIQLDYVGLFNGGTIGIVAKGFTSQESELEWQEAGYTFTGPPVPSGVTYASTGTATNVYANPYKSFLQAQITRYVSRSSTFRYAAKNPTAPRFSGGTILSITTRPGAQSNITYGFVPLGHSVDTSSLTQGILTGYHEEIYCSSFQADPISPSWFRCTETWGARLVAGRA